MGYTKLSFRSVSKVSFTCGSPVQYSAVMCGLSTWCVRFMVKKSPEKNLKIARFYAALNSTASAGIL